MSELQQFVALARDDMYSAAPALYVLVAAMVLDTLMGTLVAFRRREVSSARSWEGATSKIGVLLIVSFACVIDPLIPAVPLALLVCLFYIVPEGFSIIEHAGRLGVPVPVFLRDTLTRLGAVAEHKAQPAAPPNPPDIPVVTQALHEQTLTPPSPSGREHESRR